MSSRGARFFFVAPRTMRWAGLVGVALCLIRGATALSPLSPPLRPLVPTTAAAPSSRAVGTGASEHVVSCRRRPARFVTQSQAASTVGGGEPKDADADAALKRGLDREFVGISLPAFVQFAAEPLASLVDTMYLGRLGATALGAAGVAISAQYSVSKLYNDPLLRTSISLVASGAGKAQASGMSEAAKKEELSQAVTSALLLATLVGIVQVRGGRRLRAKLRASTACCHTRA
jgi:hypothetical protein